LGEAQRPGISISAASKWVKTYAEVKIDEDTITYAEVKIDEDTITYAEVKIDEDTIMTAKQVKELQRRNAMLEEENLILKKPLMTERYRRLEESFFAQQKIFA